MDNPRARQARFNAESFDQWAGFAGHRERVSALLAEGGRGRLCVLGAGNANDLDLPRLLASYREVHLVDLDAAALERGARQQGVAGHPGFFRHGGMDVTGMVDAMARWSPVGEVAPAELAALVDWPRRRVGLALPMPFDAVASTCLLSQVVGNARHALGEAHPQGPAVVRAIRLGHLRLLAGLVRPGGRFVLISDVASSDWAPGLAEAAESDLAGLVPRIAREHGLIRGVDPAEILDLLRSDPALSTRLDRVALLPPWRWRLHDRTYLVCAFEARGAIGPAQPRPT